MRSQLFIFAGLALTLACSQPNQSAFIGETNEKLANAQHLALKKQQADTFEIDLAENAIAWGYADQHTMDVVVTVLDTEKKEIEVFDNPARGPEPFLFNTTTSGKYYVVIKPFEDSEGEYSLVISGAEKIADSPEDRIEQYARTFIGDGKTPGAAVAVARDGKIVYSAGFGYANLEYDIPVTPQTVFHVASLSKQVTAFAIALLADQGKISLNDDIRRYLPELNDFGHTITIDHLVHHTSGLRDQWNLLAMAGWRLDDVITQKQIMRLIAKQRELNFKPGDEMVYCNTGYTLMAEIVSRVSGESFADWTRKNIFEPLEMKNTLFYDDHEKVVQNRAYSYRLAEDGFRKSVLSYANTGATSLFTTVEDFSLWAANFKTMKVGNPNVMEMMSRRFVLNNGDTTDYSFGQGHGKYKGLNSIAHGGADAGYRTYIVRFPEQDLSVVVFGNNASFVPARIANVAAEQYLGDLMKEDPKKENATPAQQTPAVAATNEPPFDPAKVDLTEFAGLYTSDELETTYTLRLVNDTLRAYHQRHDDFRLSATGWNTFNAAAWFLGNIEFTRDAGKKVNGMRVSNGRVRNLVFRRVN